jgi:hypothetical protein
LNKETDTDRENERKRQADRDTLTGDTDRQRHREKEKLFLSENGRALVTKQRDRKLETQIDIDKKRRLAKHR